MLTNSAYDAVSVFVSFLARWLSVGARLDLVSVSIRITFCTNAFFSDILMARLATAFDAKINFGRDRLMA